MSDQTQPEFGRIYVGDCRLVLKDFPADYFHAVVTDPPYELTANKKGGSGPASMNPDSPAGRARVTTGFMGMKWDGTGVAFDPETWRQVLRVMRPGAHLLAFSGTRTYHRMVCAIEDAGFEIRDQVQWLYGQGFPKSLNIPLALDKMDGAPHRAKAFNMKGRGDRAEELDGNGRDFPEAYEPRGAEAKKWAGFGTALKPANEPIVLARKPLSEPTVAANVLRWGTGGLNIEASRIAFRGESDETEAKDKNRHADFGSGPRENRILGEDKRERGAGGNYDPTGRWPANVIVDQYAAGFLDAQEPGSSRVFYVAKPDGGERNAGLDDVEGRKRDESRKEGNPGGDNPRNRGVHAVANFHPTVKPVDLMAYLIRLVTPAGGGILDPFTGSGTTGIAAARLGHPFQGVELEADYAMLAEKRIALETRQGRLL